MKLDQFLQQLKDSSYPEPILVHQPPNGSLDNHSHPFAVQALVLEGYIEISISGKTQKYGVGEVFELAVEELHAESYGPEGVKYLASRKN
jgi:quercetin dioxygenase-like cupin family protein